MRGEDSPDRPETDMLLGSPPLARGRPAPAIANKIHPGLTPACAGKTDILKVLRFLDQAHPRLRGEDCFASSFPIPFTGSPPLARGRPVAEPQTKPLMRLTPACAGKTRGVYLRQNDNQAHPRLRGEDIGVHNLGYEFQGSPPLARGRPTRRSLSSQQRRLTPACAGKT